MNIPYFNDQMHVQTIIYSKRIGNIVLLETVWAGDPGSITKFSKKNADVEALG